MQATYSSSWLTLAVFLLKTVLLCGAESSNNSKSISTNATTTAATQSLTAKNAKLILELAKESQAGPGPGTWRHIQIQLNLGGNSTNVSYATNVIYEWLRAGAGPALRTERFDSSSTNSRPHVQIDNEEGSWALHEEVAIFLPPSGSKASGIVNKPGGFEWNLTPIELDYSDSEFAADGQINGERFQEGGRWLIRITAQFGEKSKIKYTRMIRKRIPLLFRPFFKTAELRKLVDETLPSRYEWVLDPETYTVLLLRAYRNDGVLFSETQGWCPWTNLPPENYKIPKDITRIRPKSLEEANRLDLQMLDVKK